MALLPKISLTLENKCDKVDICEKTGIYSVGNTGGWGAPNIETGVVTAATVTVLDTTGTSTLQTFNILPTYTTGIQPPYLAFDGASWSQGDGAYKVVYSVVGPGPVTYTNNEQYVLFCCNLQNCIDKLIGKLVEECDAIKLEKYKTTLDQLEVLKYGVKTAFACGNFARVTALLTNAATICTTFSGCDCICSCDC